MEIFGIQQHIILTAFTFLIFVLSLIFVTFLACYNALYLSRILNSNKQIGLHPPERIHHLIKTTIYLPIFTAVSIIIFLAMKWY